MILIGIDDTDTVDTPGTNQLAKRLVRTLSAEWRCIRIVRHQLLYDSRIPYTSKNGSASILLESRDSDGAERNHDSALKTDHLTATVIREMNDWFVSGSDPGLCIASRVSSEIAEFGRRCQKEIVTQKLARELAAEHGLFLCGLGGTEDGVVGAVAAVGLGFAQNDGRIVQHAEWPDDLCDVVPVETLWSRDVHVWDYDLMSRTGNVKEIRTGIVNVGRHLRPNLRSGKAVLFVSRDRNQREFEHTDSADEDTVQWMAHKLT